ncbi:CotZ-related putative spore coat protein [Bacillus atrophaeus]|uniref:CotZ-related putative spore coat protein n=1 Tax=Bacillus atrophaeus TaxID=1452 RepID=UPI002E1DC975|nr:CotZ-related putative spore coat protein [Bacillus atrophaeus]
MTNFIIEKLKENHNINKKVEFVQKCSSLTPIFLINQEGEHFFASGLSNGHSFQTCYFIVISVNELRNCVVLELLVPCCMKPICANKALYRTDSRILIDISFLCGIGEVNIPVYDYLVLKTSIKDNFDICFSTSENKSSILWNNESNFANTATVTLHHKDNEDSAIKIILQTKENIFSLGVKKGESCAITVKDLECLKVYSSKRKLHGLIEVQLNHIKKTARYF